MLLAVRLPVLVLILRAPALSGRCGWNEIVLLKRYRRIGVCL